MDQQKRVANALRKELRTHGGRITVAAASPAARVLETMSQKGEVKRGKADDEYITYIVRKQTYREHQVVIWTKADGSEHRARVVSITTKRVRIVLLDADEANHVVFVPPAHLRPT